MKPEILFLAHRIPYPPNRGDKMRSWHVLRHLGRYATVHLAAFADDAADAAHLGALREAMGGSLGEAYIEPRHRKRSWPLRALLRNQPATVAAFHGSGMEDFAKAMLARPQVGAVFAFSIQMAQFVPADARQRFVMDFVDFDSAKYAGYAAGGRGLRKLALIREARRLQAYEKAVAERADIGLFVSGAEAALFREAVKPKGADIRALSNGIDFAFYDPKGDFAPLADPPAPLIVFTGQMDYQPNVEGVRAFACEVMPAIRARCPPARFAIVGRRPVAAVRELDGQDGVIVTGEVPDVRPWLAAASVVVAPLQIARGVQNKVLEAMAMARPVVASTGAFEGIDARSGTDLIVADGAADQADAVLTLFEEPERAALMAKSARARMVSHYGWDAQLAPLAAMLGLDVRKQAA
ncbi:MAG TPA: TIGR03087 family PEP-CTERM/XrtA system glycosyltransferase [Allosphingosinicella sp.]|jgi:sugar transferase (PEP-CTERM/EpsH1 system associated)|nr:TIGR03087 family PEP-CTERM/XrtA system glycosyltransferase [Allosphingosinicella sp.]